LKEIIKQRQRRRAAVVDQKSLGDLIDQENRQYTTPTPPRRRGGVLPAPDLSQLNLLQLNHAPPGPHDDPEEHDEPRQNGFPIETLHNNIDTHSNSGYQDMSDLEIEIVEQDGSNNNTQDRFDDENLPYVFDEYTQTSPQTNLSR